MDNLYEENVECDFETYYCRSECCGGVIGGQTMMF